MPTRSLARRGTRLALTSATVALALALGLGAALAATAATTTTTSQGRGTAAPGVTCRAYTQTVTLTPAATTRYQVTSRLCATSRELTAAGQPAQLLVPGATDIHGHWQITASGQADSDHATRMAAAGIATLSLGPIGPSPGGRMPRGVALSAAAYVTREIDLDLRHGAIGGARFADVILTGRALGATIAMAEEDYYDGTDGVIIANPAAQATRMGRDAKAPILVVAGRRDRQLCGQQARGGAVINCASGRQIRAAIAPGFPAAARLQACAAPGARSLATQPARTAEFTDILSWSRQILASHAGLLYLPGGCS